ncbi:FYVE-FINGER-CONTAINING RAB5 EFFECTOR PROTEIN RABENOSYN-5-RELATED [Plasmopara halstedii]|uniref:FYVE-FINGER-CONTAINING RAB5 EFFECTOR PROTEIN RABENOSYN-5-RELATED n=1 Tax=Plasmopara halstedii TaxID=4781 RepID=A0A0P1A938_PLAHL|nr:FYVE-FINGER-CONTAINING RAB5 EFFECTOR PROTEIN RABENOSYN-5-RELATED [Plasmopara halstedii]CEG36693.1 FYVE-FINGER-CONTAINING RAB5 EFFECTOR PROTEIN RABENOSYN-5-RELATED [Plasmopara halstedii]|eukprot:XP_024573062.1 FYVE-FINGER-CONTAINING RAB5 EFFECTOR PROTEIN RABENOSYN-5-RELATED [Plasmopara halstedii]
MGGKKRFLMNPFPSMELSAGDKLQMQKTANSFLAESLQSYEMYLKQGANNVDERQWKLIKTRENLRLYLEREVRTTTDGNHSMMDEASEQAGTPVTLCVGKMHGNVEDVVYGTMCTTSEDMCFNATYVDDLSGAAVLATVLEPTLNDPLTTITLKWQELNLLLHSNKRDYVFMEATGFTQLGNGKRVGYRLMYSIGFPQTPELPNRVRASVNVFFLYRQLQDHCVEMYSSGVVANGSNVESLSVTPSAMKFFTALKFAHCGEMKKLTWLMHRRYTLDKQRGASLSEGECISCGIPISSKIFSTFGRFRDSCKLCHRLVCGTCRVKKRLNFVTLEMTFEERKTSFCPLCIKDAFEISASDAARAQITGNHSDYALHSGTDYSFASSSDSEQTV